MKTEKKHLSEIMKVNYILFLNKLLSIGEET